MCTTLSEEKTKLLKNIAECKGFQDFQVKVTAGSLKGDGYLGIINIVDIQDSINSSKELHLIAKSALTEEKLRETTPIKKAYEREIYMYQNVFPEFRKLSDEVGIRNRFNEAAKCYGSLLIDQEECLVLENLKELNFKLWNRKVPMNEKHVELVFATYAKFHGTGLALKMLKPEKFEEWRGNLVNIFLKENETDADKKQFEDSFKHVFGNGFRAVAHNESATQSFSKFAQNCNKFFLEHVRKFDKYCTILHGDCWCNNMMFKYDNLQEPSKPTEMCLLDWQMSHVGSPILDLSYFFYACSGRDTLYKLKTFLKIYHSNLAQTVQQAGLDPDEVLTYQELENQWKIYSKYGLFASLFVIKVILSEVEEAPDFSELAKSGKDILESITTAESTNLESINERISDVVVFMDEHEYL